MADSMRILSLFDGISAAQVAINRLGIKDYEYFASEIDKYAIQVAHNNFPNTIQIGDVTKIKGSNYKEIDLLIGGSPCQGFSFAGKQLNFGDERSKLFFEYVRILREVKPKYFVLENVKMKKEYQDVISKELGVEPVEINSNLLSAQNRKRLYWSNIPIVQPVDRGIYLKDIIETGIVDRDKSHCLDTNYFKGGNLKQYFEKHRRQLVFSRDGLCHIGEADIKGNDSIKIVYHINGKSPTLSTCQGGNREPKILIGPTALTGTRTEEAKQFRREHKKATGKDFSPRRAKELKPRMDNKMNCLTATYSSKEHNIIDEKLYYRRLTTVECERLQTFTDNYTDCVSNTQRYKALGNSFTVDVIAHILKAIL